MVRCLAKTVLLVFILSVAVPSLQAAEPGEEARSVRSGSAALVSWGFLGTLWDSLTLAGSDNGCRFDPNGGCGETAATDNGCLIDPNGGCRETAVTDNGCLIDPSGGCRD